MAKAVEYSYRTQEIDMESEFYLNNADGEPSVIDKRNNYEIIRVCKETFLITILPSCILVMSL